MKVEIFGQHARVGIKGFRREEVAGTNVIAWPRPVSATTAMPPVEMAMAPPSAISLAEAMTVRETRFFRDVLPFELLRSRLVPRLMRARARSRMLRLWSAGCSTGQEVWSLAMLMEEVLGDAESWSADGWSAEILGTDLSQRAVAAAMRGSYRGHEITPGLSPLLRRRYFEPEMHRHVFGQDHAVDRWQISERLRSGVSFRVHDQREPLDLDESHERPDGKFDIVLMRNVLLYMTPAERSAALREVHRVLAPDGVLLLGVLEQAEEHTELFHVEMEDECYFYRPVNALGVGYRAPVSPWKGLRIE